jgi:hypothetical protein
MMTHRAFCHRFACAIAAVGLTLALGSPGVAQTDGTASYDLDFTTDFDWILDYADPVAQYFAMCKTPLQLAAARSVPMIRLTNATTSPLDITNLRIDIGDPNFLFDTFAFREQPDNGAAVLNFPTDMMLGGDRKSFLEISLPHGLAPGDSLTFQVRLVAAVGTALANYEDVLWDKSNLVSPNRTDNAQVTVSFGDLTTTNGLQLDPVPSRLWEYPLANASFPNDGSGHDTTGASGFSLVPPGGADMEIVGFARFTQSIVVPEPSSLMLGAVGLSMLLVGGRRRTKRIRS